MRLIFRAFCILAFALLTLSGMGNAQVISANLNGTVSDSTGALIPGARVTLKNIDTGLQKVVTTNASGFYNAADLPPGRYSATIEKQGFQRSVQTGIVLTVSQIATANITLPVGDAGQTVTVEANEQLINATTADLSNLINSEAVEELPLNGRDPTQLALLSPGTSNVFTTGNQQSTQQTTNSLPGLEGAISSGGGRQGSTYVLLDGAPNMDNYLGTALPAPNADATQEFRVITQNFDAQYGFATNAVISLQSKSGTNAFHGGIFEFVRNNDFNAADYFTKQKDLLKRNQFGGQVGGPIFKDKLFFFASSQATRDNATSLGTVTFAPTAAELNGDFSAVTNLKAGAAQYGFVLNGKGGGTIPVSAFDPTMLNLVKIALPVGVDPLTGQVSYNAPPQVTNYNENTDRIDYTINDKQRLFLRSYILYENIQGGDIPGNIIGVSESQTGRDYNETLGYTNAINDKTVNSLTLSYLQEDTLAEQNAQTSNGQSFCWSKYINITEPAGQCYLEGFSYANVGSNWTEPIAQRRSTYDISDTFTRTIGNLTLFAGGDAHRQFSQEATEYPSAPIVQFGTGFTGNGFADLLLGDLADYQQGGGEVIPLKGYEIGLYGEVRWKPIPNLTITAGLRWDPNTPPKSVGGRGVVFEPGAKSTVYPNAPLGLLFPGDNGISAALQPTDYTVFEPRFGFAYQPKNLPKTVVRGGIGLFTGPILYNYYNHFVDIAPFSPYYTVSTLFDANGNPTNPVKIDNPWAASAGSGSPGYNPFVAPHGGFANVAITPPSNSTFGLPVDVGGSFSPNFKPVEVTTWSLSLEQQIAHDYAVHLAYVGSYTDRAIVLVDLNPGDINPADATFGKRTRYSTGAYTTNGAADYSQIYQDQSVGVATFNAIELGVEKRLSHGLQFQSNFTWEKTLDETGIGSVPIPNPYDIYSNKSISAFNLPLSWVSNFVYTTPSLKGQNGFVKALLGAFQVSSIYTLQSGEPFSINGDAGGVSSGSTEGGETAFKVPGANFGIHQGSKSQWLAHYMNAAAFTNNPSGTFGDSRFIFHTVRLNYADSSISKNFKFQERYNLQLRLDMFNTFNHPSFGIPDNNIGDVGAPGTPSAFGKITSSGNEKARLLQLAGKFNF